MHGIVKFDFDGGRQNAARAARPLDRNVRPAHAGRFVVLDLSDSELLLRLTRS